MNQEPESYKFPNDAPKKWVNALKCEENIRDIHRSSSSHGSSGVVAETLNLAGIQSSLIDEIAQIEQCCDQIDNDLKEIRSLVRKIRNAQMT